MIVAIDPGITGAIAWFDLDQLIAIDDMPVEKVRVGKTMRSRVDPRRLVDMLDVLEVQLVDLLDHRLLDVA